MTYISNLMIPLLVLVVIGYGLYKKIDIYDVFVNGAKESFDMVFTLFPCLLGMIFGINIFLKSGALNIVFDLVNPFFEYLKIPLDIFPMALLRPISGSSALAILNNILESSGPDSFIGRMASILQGSTDTTFYVLTLYFGTVGIKKIKHALWVGIISDIAGMIAAIVLTTLLFST